MSKWKWLIIEEDGSVTGTDEDTVARDYSTFEQYTVINTETSFVHYIDEAGTEQTFKVEKADSIEGDEFEGGES